MTLLATLLLFFFFWLVEFQFRDQGSNPSPWPRECRILTTGAPGNSHLLLSVFHITTHPVAWAKHSGIGLVPSSQNPSPNPALLPSQFLLSPSISLRAHHSDCLSPALPSLDSQTVSLANGQSLWEEVPSCSRSSPP